jgi:ankyrin repeat protein
MTILRKFLVFTCLILGLISCGDKTEKPSYFTKDVNPATPVDEENKFTNLDYFNAIERNDLTLVIEILRSGIDINGIHEGRFPLHVALKEHQLDIAKYLIANGSLLDIYNDHADSLMDIAFRSNNVEIAKMLKKFGAKIINAEKLFNFAMDNENRELISIIMDDPRTNFNINGAYKQDLFIYALERNDANLLKYFLQNRYNVNLPIRNSELTPLTFALRINNFEFAQILLAKSANIDQQDGDRKTTLIRMILDANLASVEWLMKKGASNKPKDLSGNKACKYAKRITKSEVIGEDGKSLSKKERRKLENKIQKAVGCKFIHLT